MAALAVVQIPGKKTTPAGSFLRLQLPLADGMQVNALLGRNQYGTALLILDTLLCIAPSIAATDGPLRLSYSGQTPNTQLGSWMAARRSGLRSLLQDAQMPSERIVIALGKQLEHPVSNDLGPQLLWVAKPPLEALFALARYVVAQDYSATRYHLGWEAANGRIPDHTEILSSLPAEAIPLGGGSLQCLGTTLYVSGPSDRLGFVPFYVAFDAALFLAQAFSRLGKSIERIIVQGGIQQEFSLVE